MLNNVQSTLFNRPKSNDLSVSPPTDYSKLTYFDDFDQNDQSYPKAISTTNGPKIKVDNVLESSRLILQNKIFLLNTWLESYMDLEILTIFDNMREKFLNLTRRLSQQPLFQKLKLITF